MLFNLISISFVIISLKSLLWIMKVPNYMSSGKLLKINCLSFSNLFTSSKIMFSFFF